MGSKLRQNIFDATTDDVETAFQLNEKPEEKRFYSLSNVMNFFDGVFKNQAEQLRRDFIKMVAFDAFIGAPDRHAMNWGVLASHESSRYAVRFSPVFDTARGLFREISDRDLKEKIEKQGKSGFIEQYANRSKPILSIDNNVDLNHFNLIKRIFDENKFNDQDALLTIFNAVNICDIKHMLQLKFRRIITQFRMGLICDLLTYRIDRISKDLQL
ncbi:MAG: HipA domain-containing protein [Gammaproteobacteria bacterium]|nr:HipA domain-containing protein [Gammaproteobacteria bacterium]